MGLTPHREAKAASEWSRSGLLPAAMRRVAAVSGPIGSSYGRGQDRTLRGKVPVECTIDDRPADDAAGRPDPPPDRSQQRLI